MTDLSIVIVAWNSLHVLEGCLQSIEREVLSRQDDGRLEVETIVVDNGSTDGTVAAVRERYAFVELVSLDENLGFAEGNNVGLRRAHARRSQNLTARAGVRARVMGFTVPGESRSDGRGQRGASARGVRSFSGSAGRQAAV